jgi:hypothetical protein
LKALRRSRETQTEIAKADVKEAKRIWLNAVRRKKAQHWREFLKNVKKNDM